MSALVKSGHVRYTRRCLLCANSGHCGVPIWVNLKF